MYRNQCWPFLNYVIYHALCCFHSGFSTAFTLKHVRSHFIAPVVRLDRKCWLWGLKFRSEHLPEGGKLWPPEWAACDLSPQLCDFKSHASVGKHTCWKACWECGRAMSTHIGRIKSHLPNQIHFEECLVIWGQCGFVQPATLPPFNSVEASRVLQPSLHSAELHNDHNDKRKEDKLTIHLK